MGQSTLFALFGRTTNLGLSISSTEPAWARDNSPVRVKLAQVWKGEPGRALGKLGSEIKTNQILKKAWKIVTLVKYRAQWKFLIRTELSSTPMKWLILKAIKCWKVENVQTPLITSPSPHLNIKVPRWAIFYGQAHKKHEDLPAQYSKPPRHAARIKSKTRYLLMNHLRWPFEKLESSKTIKE